MKQIFWQIVTIILIFIGEFGAIYAEILTAKRFSLDQTTGGLLMLKGFLMAAMAGVFLVAGYALGFKAFKNIWIVSAVSITSILIIEPILAYTIFNQLPTKGALIGLVFGVLGFISALFL